MRFLIGTSILVTARPRGKPLACDLFLVFIVGFLYVRAEQSETVGRRFTESTKSGVAGNRSLAAYVLSLL
jgi:hypothetical protein